MKKTLIRAAIIAVLTFSISVPLQINPKDSFSASTYQFQFLDSSNIPKKAFSQGELIRYKLNLNFDFITIIISSLKVEYQGAPAEDLGYKVNLFIPGISSNLRSLQSRSISTIDIAESFSSAQTWKDFVPATAWDTTQVTLNMLTIPGTFNLIERTFTVENDDANDDDIDSSSYICSACHQGLYYGWRASKHSPTVGCETCHGSGKNHILTQSPDDIKTPGSADFCNVCHSRNNANIVEAESGFIKHMQQKNEISSTGHSRLNCLTCHSPHYGPSAGVNFGIKRTCSSCHTDTSVGLNMQQLDCIDCHMPYAIENNTSTGTGNYKKGDVRSHVVRIKGTDSPEDMFDFTRDNLALDETGKPFLTVNFACLTCHNGTDAGFQNYDAMQFTHGLIH